MRRIVGSGSIALLALAYALAGCGGGGGGPAGVYGGNGGNTTPPPGGGTSTTADISVNSNSAFNPASTTVPAGTTVTWTFNGCGSDGYGGQVCVDHNVTWDDGATPPSASKSSGSYSRTFATAGTYNYHCSIHGTTTTGMRGSVTVQ